VLLAVLEGTLRLAHPFIAVHHGGDLAVAARHGAGSALIRQPYPGDLSDLRDLDAEARMDAVIEVTRAIRSLKLELGVAQKTVDLAVLGDAAGDLLRGAERPGPRHPGASGSPASQSSAAGSSWCSPQPGWWTWKRRGRSSGRKSEAAQKELAGWRRAWQRAVPRRAAPEIVEKTRRQATSCAQRLAAIAERLRQFEAM